MNKFDYIRPYHDNEVNSVLMKSKTICVSFAFVYFPSVKEAISFKTSAFLLVITTSLFLFFL